MAIKYYLTKCNIKSSSNYGKYYARTLRGNEVTLDDLEREIEHACSATRGDVKLCFRPSATSGNAICNKDTR
jgi:hypothetical protein